MEKVLVQNQDITFGESVMVSDPCYEVGTWCQVKLNDVLPGEYKSFLRKTSNTGGWGTRCSVLVVVHKDHLDDKLTWRKHHGEIGVDSGQAGIFSMESYKNDSIVDTIETPDSKFTLGISDRDGDKWYEKMCQFTLSDNQWGSYNGGVVSSSGIGDGGYVLLTAKKNGKIVGMAIDYLMESFPNYFINTIING